MSSTAEGLNADPRTLKAIQRHKKVAKAYQQQKNRKQLGSKPSAASKAMSMMFPDMPINAGLARGLAVWSLLVNKSAQPLVTFSWVIIPIALAVAWKSMQLLGALPAFLVALGPLAAVLEAETILRERAVLPLPNSKLKVDKQGKPVFDTSEDTEAAKLENELLELIHNGVVPVYAAKPASRSAEAIVPSATAGDAKTGDDEPAAAAVPIEAVPPPPSSEGSRSGPRAVENSELAQLVGRIYETLHGDAVDTAMHDLKTVLQVINQVRTEIGLPHSRDDTYEGMKQSAQEAADTLGI